SWSGGWPPTPSPSRTRPVPWATAARCRRTDRVRRSRGLRSLLDPGEGRGHADAQVLVAVRAARPLHPQRGHHLTERPRRVVRLGEARAGRRRLEDVAPGVGADPEATPVEGELASRLGRRHHRGVVPGGPAASLVPGLEARSHLGPDGALRPRAPVALRAPL